MTIVPPDPDKPYTLKIHSSDWKKFLLASLVFIAFIFITDTLLFGFIAGDFFSMPGMKEMPDMGTMTVGFILGGLLFCYTYLVYGRNVSFSPDPKPAAKGRFFGVVVALLIFLPSAFFYNSLMEGWSLTSALVETVYRLVQFGIAGILVAVIIERKKKVVTTESRTF